MTSMPLVDLSAQRAAVADEVAESWRDVLPRTTFIGGPQIASFESEYAAFIGVSHCVGVANGTDATEIALHALPGRDRVLKELHAAGIGAGTHYLVPTHLTPAFTSLGFSQGSFPVAERAARDLLTLPLFPEITPERQEYVVSALIWALQ